MDDSGGKAGAKPSLLERLSAFLTREPEDREELLELLHGAFEHKLLDADALSMIEGVLSVSEMTVRDIMIPRAQMDVVDINDPPEKFLPFARPDEAHGDHRVALLRRAHPAPQRRRGRPRRRGDGVLDRQRQARAGPGGPHRGPVAPRISARCRRRPRVSSPRRRARRR